jgi:hypothetical protein
MRIIRGTDIIAEIVSSADGLTAIQPIVNIEYTTEGIGAENLPEGQNIITRSFTDKRGTVPVAP